MTTESSSALPRVGVVGGSGYTGRELLRILARHRGVETVWATSRSEAGQATPVPGLVYRDLGVEGLAEIDLVFLCLPHGAAVPWMEAAIEAGIRVVDLTADHRPGSGREEGVVYGLTERNSAAVATAQTVANPGCYPTGVILALEPLLDADLLAGERTVTVAAASGVTGAGRSPKPHLLFSEVHGDYRAYGLGNGHRHLREMRALLPGVPVLFVPHLLPVPRGILETMAVPLRDGMDAAAVRAAWRNRYAGSAMIEVLDAGAPALRDVVDTDRLVLSVVDNEGLAEPTVTVVAAFDNLGKGAAGQAVQNMNLMLGLNAEEGLRCRR